MATEMADVRLCGLGPVLGVLYLMLAAEVYTADASLMIKNASSPLQPRQDFRESGQLLGTQIEFIKSRPVIERALEIYEPLGLDVADPVESIRKSLRTTVMEDTSIVKLSFRGLDPEDCVQGLSAIVASYKQNQRQLERDSYLETLQFLTRRESELRTELEAKETAYRLVREQSPLISLGNEVARADQEILTDLGKQLAEIKSRRMDFESQMLAWFPGTFQQDAGVARQTSQDGAEQNLFKPALVDDAAYLSLLSLKPVVELLGNDEALKSKEDLIQAQSREKELISRFGDRHAEVKAVRSQIADAQQRLDAIIGQLPNWLSRELDTIRHHEQTLVQEYQSQFQKIKDSEIHSIKEQQAADQLERSLSLYTTAVNQLSEWRVAEDSNNRQALEVIDVEPPHNSGEPSWPQKKLVLALALLLGFGGGAGLIAVVEGWDRRFWSVRQVSRWSRQRIIGQIPVISGITAVMRCLSVLHQPHARAAEAFRAIRSIIDSQCEEQPGRFIQITSQGAHVGTTTVVSNLAIAFANIGKRVLVIDGDLQHGKLSKVFAVEDRAVGLNSFLRGETALDDAVVTSGVANIDVLAGGPKVKQAIDLLSDEKVAGMRSLLGDQYDVILCDTPPLLHSAEAPIFAGYADDVILTARIGRSKVSDFQAEHELLQSLGKELTGIIINYVTTSD